MASVALLLRWQQPGSSWAGTHRADGRLRDQGVLNRSKEMGCIPTMTEVRPFSIDVPDAVLDDLRRRIGAVRWPSRELVTDRSQDVPLATMQALARYWTERRANGEASSVMTSAQADAGRCGRR